MGGTSITLTVIGDHTVSFVVRSGDIVYEPRTDLVAAVSETNDVHVFRLGGQQVQHLEQDDLSGKPTSISWSRGGDILLIGTDESMIDILDLRRGRLTQGRPRAHQSADGAAAQITGIATCIAQVSLDHDESGNAPKTRPNGKGIHDSSITDWLHRMQITSTNGESRADHRHATASLPRALASINQNDVLPKLSPIPPPSKAGPGMPAPVVRSAQKDIHTSINSKTTQSAGAVEVTFISFGNGDVDGSVGDLFPHTFSGNPPPTAPYHKHCEGSKAGRHAMLRGVRDGEDGSLSQLEVDIYRVPFSRSESVHTGTMLSNATIIRQLGLYLTQTVETISLDWQTLTGLPARFIANINETLEEKGEQPVQNHLLQLLLTGHCSPTVTEWLKEELAERGHKRWDAAMTTFYDSLTSLFEVNLLPALEKCALSASALRGLATYYEGSKHFDVPRELFTHVIDVISNLVLLGHEALQILRQEDTQFRAFSKWLRSRIDVAAGEPGSTATMELIEAEAMNTDPQPILAYLTNGFVRSKLQAIVNRRLQAMEIDKLVSTTSLTREETMASIKDLRKSSICSNNQLALLIQMRYLQQKLDACHSHMKRWQATTWLPPTIIPLDIPQALQSVSCKLSTAEHESGFSVNLAGIDAADPASAGTMLFRRVQVRDERKLSTYRTTGLSQRNLLLPKDCSFIAAQLQEDLSLTALIERTDPADAAVKSCSVIQMSSSVLSSGTADLTLSPKDIHEATIHNFAGDDGFRPSTLIISEGKRRRNMLILDKNRQRWKIFRMPDKEVQRTYTDIGEENSPFGIAEERDGMLAD